MKRKVILWSFGGVFLVSMGTLVWSLLGFSLSGCKNQGLQELSSPPGKWKVVIFQRDCGATTGFRTQVSVLPAHAELKNEHGNLFVAATYQGGVPSGPGGGPQVAAAWTSDKTLAIRYDKRARVYQAETKYKEITISYENSI